MTAGNGRSELAADYPARLAVGPVAVEQSACHECLREDVVHGVVGNACPVSHASAQIVSKKQISVGCDSGHLNNQLLRGEDGGRGRQSQPNDVFVGRTSAEGSGLQKCKLRPIDLEVQMVVNRLARRPRCVEIEVHFVRSGYGGEGESLRLCSSVSGDDEPIDDA